MASEAKCDNARRSAQVNDTPVGAVHQFIRSVTCQHTDTIAYKTDPFDVMMRLTTGNLKSAHATQSNGGACSARLPMRPASAM
jgi:hypothetical protein